MIKKFAKVILREPSSPTESSSLLALPPAIVLAAGPLPPPLSRATAMPVPRPIPRPLLVAVVRAISVLLPALLLPLQALLLALLLLALHLLLPLLMLLDLLAARLLLDGDLQATARICENLDQFSQCFNFSPVPASGATSKCREWSLSCGTNRPRGAAAHSPSCTWSADLVK